MINDMEFHIRAWKGLLNNDLNAGLNREQVKSQMYGKNSELLIRVFGEQKIYRRRNGFLVTRKRKKISERIPAAYQADRRTGGFPE